ncbi:hypothetical protein [Roseovarius sp. MMSF_3281]|uniref:hypothetical protein n=1 Tax=Roseovarius sp. MMSF_3281 TaxID=3046694 RepID=UPI00273EC01E|nr:hypothetical protein [Roseovarius sp. MMSF_3281]
MLDKDVKSGNVTYPNPSIPQANPVFLVLERDILIAEDIVASLKDIGPCQTVHVSDPQALIEHLSDYTRISAAFLEMRFDQMVELGLDRRLADMGARVVLTIGEDDESLALAHGWSMLVRPFTDEMIRATLANTTSKA